jgi:uncharacterized Zn finger protein
VTDPFSTPFVTMFESLGMGARFQRGRRDARAGHVRHLSINTSLVLAQVRGPEEPVTHRARIAVRAFGAAAWSRIEADLAAEARHVADLIAGRLPEDIDEVIARAGLRLLPDSIGDVAMDCTCEQWPMPCGHLAAACYALARSFDTDPFGALAWRGRDRDELLTRLHELRRAAAPAADRPAAPATGGPPNGLGDPAAFWSATGEPPAPAGAADGLSGADRRTDALLDELEPLVFGGRSITESLRPAYLALVRTD